MGTDAPDQLGEEFWDERYRSQPALWSGKPNRYLVSEVSGMEPGSALDAGSGEGADAIWLAEQGWQVTAVDISGVALQRAAEEARSRGAAVAGRIEWVREDLTAWQPAERRYDLVTAHYLHMPSAVRRPFFSRLASAVAPGGSLLIVGHDVSDLQTTIRRPPDPDRYFSNAEVAAALGPGQWQIVTDAHPPREATDPEGQSVTIHETVFRAQRQA